MAAKKKNKSEPFQFMIENRNVIIDAIQESSSLSKAWQLLSQRLPQIQRVTKFNTFKGYARVLNFVDQQLDISKKKLDKVRQEKSMMKKELDKVRQDRDTIQQQLDKVRQKLSKTQMPNFLSNFKNKPDSIDVPKHVDGWGVQLKGNYYRLFKKINGKLKWIHIGRKWNVDLAKTKIKRFNG
jgi:hypothetical protein